MDVQGLFSPLTVRGITFRNRIGMSPMCQYSSTDGKVEEWHIIHYGSRAVGGAGLIVVEASAVEADGRISPGDLGVWSYAQVEGLARIAHAVRAQGSVIGIQLAHAGRKASTPRPWEERKLLSAGNGGWSPIRGASPIPFDEHSATPEQLDRQQIAGIVNAFAQGAHRAVDAGMQLIEIHAAHGYLIHQFLSPHTNKRVDEYGGSFENRTRLAREVVTAVRAQMPEELPLFIRISATDWAEGGWDVDQSVRLMRELKQLGVDMVDCSSGGLLPGVKIPLGPGYQVPFAERIRREAGVPTAAVGLIREPAEADRIIRSGSADMVLLARELLRDPYWPQRAAKSLGAAPIHPVQYARASE
jgi:2,4-dienoyl-CoA reductase-like NADH-dependent reductase (Old Yellow Enzyme family)